MVLPITDFTNSFSCAMHIFVEKQKNATTDYIYDQKTYTVLFLMCWKYNSLHGLNSHYNKSFS